MANFMVQYVSPIYIVLVGELPDFIIYKHEVDITLALKIT